MDALKKNKIEDKLDIFITTYNRCDKLARTLDSFSASPFANCSITVLNNASTDGTLDVIEKRKDLFANLKVVTHPFNIGGDANIIRTLEYCTKEYMWIVHDDDLYDFSVCSDLFDVILEGRVNYIHVGAHVDNIRQKFQGKLEHIQSLDKQGYPYFLYASFTPCNIFKFSEIIPFVPQGYENIHNHYSIYPYIISKYENNDLLYVTKKQIVKAQIGCQNYNDEFLVNSWYGTSFLFSNKENGRLYFCEQFSRNRSLLRTTLYRFYQELIERKSFVIKRFVYYLKWYEKILFLFLAIPYFIARRIKNILIGK